MIVKALRTLWVEPRVANPPPRGWSDWMLVLAVVVLALIEVVGRDGIVWRPVVVVVTIAVAPTLLWRRTHPLACVAVGFGVGTALAVAGMLAGRVGVGLGAMSFVLVLVYALVRWASGRDIAIGLSVVVIAAASSVVTDGTDAAELYGGLGVLAAAVAGGAALRFRAENWRRIREQIRNDERVALARDLHDSIAHHVSAITVQAQAGRAVVAARPEAALEALTAIEAEASTTLAEMRSMVQVLRQESMPDYAPQRRTTDLMRLTRRSPSPTVDVDLVGPIEDLPADVDAAVYRIAQEALTNALRHAEGASTVSIEVIVECGRVRIRVVDDGRIDPRPGGRHGFGLLGMTERANLLGGTLRAGPVEAGGWLVEAELPLAVSR